MGIKRALVYELHCDNCDRAFDPYDEGTRLWNTARDLQRWLLADFIEEGTDEWTTDGFEVHCGSCPELEEGPEAEAERARILEAQGEPLAIFAAAIPEGRAD